MKQNKVPEVILPTPMEPNKNIATDEKSKLAQEYKEANNDVERNKTIDEWRHLDCEGWE